jgi:hypothetical protein
VTQKSDDFFFSPLCCATVGRKEGSSILGLCHANEASHDANGKFPKLNLPLNWKMKKKKRKDENEKLVHSITATPEGAGRTVHQTNDSPGENELR